MQDERKTKKELIEELSQLRSKIAKLEHAKNEYIQTENVLIASEKKFRSLVEVASDFILEIDPNGNFLYASKGVDSLLGYQPHEILGKNIFDFMPPLEAKRAAEAYREFIKSNEKIYNFEHVFLHKNGREIAVESSGLPVTDETGNLICYRGISRDITKRRQAEEAIRKQAIMIDQAYDSIISTDLDGNVTSWNKGAEKMFGYLANETLGRNISFIYPDDQLNVLEHEVIAPLKQKGEHEAEVKLRRKSGQEFYGLLALSLLRADDGTVIGMLGSSMEITERKLAEEEIQRYEYIVSSSNDMLALLDRNFVYQAVNKAYLEPFGLSRRDVIGHGVSEVLGEKIFKEIIRPNAEQCLNGEHVHFSEWLDFPVRGKRYMEINYYPYLGADREVKGFVVNARDITEHKQAEEAVRESEEKYRAIVAAFDGLIYTCSHDYRIEFINQRYIDKLGFDPTGQLCYKALQNRDDICSWCDNERVFRGETVKREVKNEKDGRWYYITNTPIHHADGSVSKQSLIIDITQRKIAEWALDVERRRLENILEGTNVGTWEWNVQTGETVFNERWAEIIGCTLGEISPVSVETWKIYTHPDDLKMALELLDKHFKGELNYYECEIRMRHKSGDWIWVLDRGKVATWTKDGKPLIMAGTHQDITRRKRAEEALEKRLVALTRPLDDAESITFEALFNLDDIQRLQDEFARATGVASIITHPDGVPITAPSNFCRFCIDIIRKTDKGRANCYRSDALIGQLSAKGPTIQPCMSGGLWDAGAGISVGGRHIANWLIGQVRNETQSEDKIRAYAREIGADETTVVEAFREVPAMSREQFGRVAQVLFTLANQLSTGAYQNVQQARFITERKQTEMQLLASEQLFRALVENSPDYIGRYDLEFRRIYVNPALLKLIGGSAENVIGHLTSEGTPLYAPQVYIDRIRQAIETAAECSLELPYRNLQGEMRWGHQRFVPEFGPGGKVTSVLAIGRDIHEIKAKEMSFRMLAENFPDFIVRTDREGRFSYINSAFGKSLGIQADDMHGKTMLELQLHDALIESEMLLEHSRRTFDEGAANECEVRWKTEKGERIFEVRTVPEKDAVGSVVSTLSIFRDITEHKRIDSIKQARLRLLEFANTHSMNELLTATLDEIEALTGSSIGFYHFLETDQKTLSLQSWSTNTLKNMCTAAGKGSHYDVSQAGVWTDCVHERRAVIHNDYASLGHRKGMPEGHAPVTREVVVPIFRGDLVKAIVGVGNKPANYYEGDVDILSQLGDLSWDIVERMQAEEALKESEERYRLLFRRSPVGVFHYDTQLHITDCNDRFVAILQSSRERLVGLDMKTLRDQSVLQALRQAAEGEEDFYEGFYRATTGSAEIWISMRSAPLVDLQGQIKGGIGIVEDFTQRKQAEEVLRSSEEEKTILNRIANVFLTISGEAMYGEVLAIVLQVMKSKFGVFGYLGEKGDLIVPSLTKEAWDECQVSGKSIVFPSDYWGNSLWGRAIREKKAFDSDGPFHTPEGHIHIDHFLTAPIIFGDEVIGLISIANKQEGYTKEDKDLLERITRFISPILRARLQRDFQEQRRLAAEENLKESEEKYRHLVTNADEAIFIIQDEVVKFPNPKTLEMTGYSSAELAEIPFINLVHPGDKGTVFEGYLRLLEGEQRPMTYPFRIKDKRGKEIWVRLANAAIIWEKKPGILCFLKDITEEKKLEAQFIQAQKMESVGRLAGGVAHDFNNLLTAIIGHSELIESRLKTNDPFLKDIKVILQASDRAAQLTSQLLAFSRKQTLQPKIIDLNQVIDNMLSMLKRIIGEDIVFNILPADKLWTIKVDPGQMEQVIINLAVNARDAMETGGLLSIKTRNIEVNDTLGQVKSNIQIQPGKYVLLSVSDTGAGMSAEVKANIFEPFFTTKKSGKGTGLGLSTVYGIISQSGGQIMVESEPGTGTTFYIYLPAVEGQIDVIEAASDSSENLKGSETILIVEDDEAVRSIAVETLKRNGYNVIEANTGGDALILCAGFGKPVDIVITDVIMPNMSGPEFIKRLEKIWPEFKRLFISGYSENDLVDQGAIIHYLQKPFHPKSLALKVRQVLDLQDQGKPV